MKRWELLPDEPWMQVSIRGEFVKYKDHLAILADIRALVERVPHALWCDVVEFTAELIVYDKRIPAIKCNCPRGEVLVFIDKATS